MNRTALLAPVAAMSLALAGAAAPAAAAAPPPSTVSVTTAGADAIRGEYIVTLKDGADPQAVAKAMKAAPRHLYANALNGFAGPLSPGQLKQLQANPAVAAIEEDGIAKTDATQPISATGLYGLYGLDRIDQRNLPLSGGYTYGTTAANVTAYVIDTGIATANSDFGGRAKNVYDGLGGNGQDCNGHGTHVAGTIGGTTYGVAKKVKLRGLRVLDCDGSGSTSGIIAAIDWLRTKAVKPAVANMSLGGLYSPATNRAVTNLANSGVSVAVAAGNENLNACYTSPASASNVVTVAASDRTDTRASFSNYGSCVETYAPGVGITSDWLNGTTKTISGTSMASPHVAGAMALYKARYGDASSATVNKAVVDGATANVVKSNRSGTPNRLLFKSSL